MRIAAKFFEPVSSPDAAREPKVLRDCFKKLMIRSRRREEADVLGGRAAKIRLLTPAATIFKPALTGFGRLRPLPPPARALDGREQNGEATQRDVDRFGHSGDLQIPAR